ncbi:MAG TPA: hypothetical protein VGO91_12015 [Pyrinomonadaceae bacterium]|jgi:hypothetical protein|nr:hypothetical protein [Pyrinomonadaceae bacterium]
MKRSLFLTLATLSLCLCFGHTGTIAQTKADADDPPKFEIGVHFAALVLDGERTEPGLGTRLTYNLTKNFALEAEGNVLPHNSRFATFRNGGRAVEGLFGVKIGKRYEKFGIFAKARPGLINFTQGKGGYVATGGGGVFPFQFRTQGATHFATDIGGVLEFYPTRRIVTRFDLGDTIIRYGSSTFNGLSTDASGTTVIFPIPIPADTSHNFQFTAGVGFRF